MQGVTQAVTKMQLRLHMCNMIRMEKWLVELGGCQKEPVVEEVGFIRRQKSDAADTLKLSLINLSSSKCKLLLLNRAPSVKGYMLA